MLLEIFAKESDTRELHCGEGRIEYVGGFHRADNQPPTIVKCPIEVFNDLLGSLMSEINQNVPAENYVHVIGIGHKRRIDISNKVELGEMDHLLE
jgi:hypothetical protein